MRKVISVLGFICVVLAFFLVDYGKNSVDDLRNSHAEFLKNSPFKESLRLTKKERKSLGIPPNKYFEREWELTMNPTTGMPEPQKVLDLQKKISNKTKAQKTPGDSGGNPWTERGPNNVGGRTRTLLFDPNDVTNKSVFAGGVSGGLWYNNDITDVNSSWTQVSGVPGNMNVSCITVDPRNSYTWYLGTGEQYTAGAAVGNGVYKTIDGGANWTNISMPAMGIGDATSGESVLKAGIYYINDIIAWDNGTSTELFVGVGSHVYRDANDPVNFLGVQSSGLYRSVNGGSNWTRIESSNMEYTIGVSAYFIPNDFEIGADNTLWMGTISTTGVGDSANGEVYSSVDGTNWVLRTTLANSDRVELAVSKTNANTIYALTQGTTSAGPHIYKTTDGFTNETELSKPVDADTNIEANDFTNGQDFYNLMIEVDPTDDDKVYVGGINLFQSVNGGTSWSQISRWHGGISGNTSVVHADQHEMTFRPGNSSQAVFGNDGGVYFASDLTVATTSEVITARNTDYNVTQFYTSALSPTAADEYFLGGTQDNGTPFFQNASKTGPDSSFDISGGDGAACFVDQVGESFLVVSYIYNNSNNLYDFVADDFRVINDDEENDGDFINQADLDSNLNILYTNGSTDTKIQIYRYSNLTSILENGTATKDTLSNALLDTKPTAIKVSPHTTSSTTMLIGTETGKIIKVLNANTTAIWSEIIGSAFVGSISDIEYGVNENEIFVTFHNYGVTSIWFSNDGGQTWLDKEGDFPDIPVKTILNNPLVASEVIIGTELGVWKTSNWNDAEPNWEQTYNGMSNVKVTDLQYRADGNKVLAATYGRGLFTGFFLDNGLSVSKEIASDETIIYPTVTKNYFNIKTIENKKHLSLHIFDSSGKIVYQENGIEINIADENRFDVDLSEGIYIVKVFDKNQVITTQQIVIKK